MTRKLLSRPRTELDVDDFFFYLAIECENPSAANRFLDALEAAYNRRREQGTHDRETQPGPPGLGRV